jgi:eukaryotic-like serine/threonine-protein kinase
MDDSTRTMHGDSAQPKGPATASGARLAAWGPFELREQVGQGGFGEVYRAWDPKLQRDVAVKLLLASRTSGPGAYEAMLREARLTAKVRHPNVVSVHGVDLHDGRVGFWTDFVRGKTLSTLLAAQGSFAAREAALIGIELCGALSAVHAEGLLHRDIKPGNVMREEGGRILLMDFGLTQDAAGGGFGGTLPYMAPELLAEQPASVASDIYALGVLLFELVTGKYPVEPAAGVQNVPEAYASGLRRSLFEERPDLPAQFARVVEMAIDPDPKKRFASAGQFLVALSGAIGISSVPMPLAPAKPRRFRWWMAAAVPVLLLAGYSVPALRTSLQRGIEQATGAHAEYLKAQDLLEHYYQPHNLENSIPLFQENIRKEPKFAPAWAGLGRAYWRRYQDTRDTRYIALARDACGKAMELGQNLSSAHVTLGMVYTDAGRNDLATQELEQAQKLDATNPEVYAAQADLYRKQGRSKEAEPALQKAIDLDPKDWRWPNQLGLYYMYYSAPVRLNDAVSQFQKAIGLTADNPRAYSNLGLAYKNQERFADARAAFEKAIQFEVDPSYLSNLGLTLQLEGEYAKAADTFRRALDLNPNNYVAAGNLASALAWTPGREEQARKAYLTAILLTEEYRKERPNDALVLARLGSYYASLGDPVKSLPLLRQAVALDPNNPQVLFKAGEGYELLHRRQEALGFLGSALQAGYSLEYIRRDPELAALRADPRFSAIAQKK